MDIRLLLKDSNYFRGISDNSLERLTRICHMKPLKKREFLFREGEPGEAVYICVSGTIQLFKTTPDGKDVVIKMVPSGEMFGEVILFEKNVYPVSAIALQRSRLLQINRSDFHHLLELADFRDDFIRMLMAKQRYLTEQIHMLSCQDVEERLFCFLLDHYGKRSEITCQLSKKDVAAAIGTTPETLSRYLLRLRNQGKLTWIGKTITIAPDAWPEGYGIL